MNKTIFFLLAFAAFASAMDCGVFIVRDEESFERANECSSFSSLEVSWRSDTPRSLEFFNLTTITNSLAVTSNINISSVSFPSLTLVGVSLTVSSNVDLEEVSLPVARSNGATVSVNNNVGFNRFEAALGTVQSVQLTGNNGTNQAFVFTDLNVVRGSFAIVACETVSLTIHNLVSVAVDFTVGNNEQLVDLVITGNSSDISVGGQLSLQTSPLSGDLQLIFTTLTEVNVVQIGSSTLFFPELVNLLGTFTVLECQNLVIVNLPNFQSSLNSGFSVRDLPNLATFNAPGPFSTLSGAEFLRVGSSSSPSDIFLGMTTSTFGSLTVSDSYLKAVRLSELQTVSNDLIFLNNTVTQIISITGSPVSVLGKVNFIGNTFGVGIYAPSLQVLSEELVVFENSALEASNGFSINFSGLNKVFAYLSIQNNTNVNGIVLSSLTLVGGYFDRPTVYALQKDLTVEFNTFVANSVISAGTNSTVFGRFVLQSNTGDSNLQANFGFVRVGGEVVVADNDFVALAFDNLICVNKITFTGNQGGVASFNSLTQLNSSLIAGTDNHNNFTVLGHSPLDTQSSNSPCVACGTAQGCSDDFKVETWVGACGTGACSEGLNAKNSPNPPKQANAPNVLPTVTGPDSPTDTTTSTGVSSESEQDSAINSQTQTVDTNTNSNSNTNAALAASSTVVYSAVVVIATLFFAL